MNDLTKTTKRVCCLYRVSSTKQLENNAEDDIPMQRQSCNDFADRMGRVVVREFHEKGVSGFKVSAEKRDAIVEIRKEAVKGAFDVLLVFMFDRLGRKEDETPFVVEWFVRQGVEVWSVQEGKQAFDSHTDKLLNYIRYWQASGESIKTSIRVKTKMAQMTQEGQFRGGEPPIGYKLVGTGVMNKRKREVMALAVDDNEAATVRQVFELYVSQGLGIKAISDRLTATGVKKRDGDNINPLLICRMLKRLNYVGVLTCGETCSETFENLRIIDDATFDKAQKLMSQRSPKNKADPQLANVPRVVRGQSLLSGNIYCGHCGGRMTASRATSKYQKRDGTISISVTPRYLCFNNRNNTLGCDGKLSYMSEPIDKQVEQVLTSVLERLKNAPSDKVISEQFEERRKDCENRLSHTKQQLHNREKELADLKQEVIKAIRGESSLSSSLLNELIEAARKDVSTLQEQFSAQQDELTNSDKQQAEIKAQHGEYLNWANIFATADVNAKKMIAAQMVDKVTVRQDETAPGGVKVEITLNVSAAKFLKDF